MSLVGSVKQQPNDVQDYDIDFSSWFPEGDVITTVALRVTPALPALPSAPSYAVSPDLRKVKVWFYSGGQSGKRYQLDVLATTDGGRAKEVELRVSIKEI